MGLCDLATAYQISDTLLRGLQSMPRLIIDSNALQSEELRAFLARSKNNFAVINDYLAMEAYKGNTMASIFRSMAILTQFPHQAIILKTTGKIAGLSGRSAGLQRRMIDERQTREFPKFCEALRSAQRGNVALRREILESGRAADRHLERMLESAPIMRDGINELSKWFTQNELRAIRKREPFPRTLIYKATEFMTELTLRTISRHPAPPPPFRNPAEMWNSFHFRSSVCDFVWSLDWIGKGGIGDVRADRIRNDMVDVIFATYATYFDGLMSRDDKARRIYDQSAFILEAITGADYPNSGGE
jgi:hypothetical protein